MLGVPETENQCDFSCAIPTRKAVRKTHPEAYVNFRPETRVDVVRGGVGIVIPRWCFITRCENPHRFPHRFPTRLFVLGLPGNEISVIHITFLLFVGADFKIEMRFEMWGFLAFVGTSFAGRVCWLFVGAFVVTCLFGVLLRVVQHEGSAVPHVFCSRGA